MSQFREAFTKEENSDTLLDYDDTAFLFFACTVLLVLLIPWSFFLFQEILHPDNTKNAHYFPLTTSNGKVYKHCQCSACFGIFEKARKENLRWKNRFTVGVIVKLSIVASLWILFCFLYNSLKGARSIIPFDPYEIIGVKPTATVAEIKKAYRVLSLQYHPDRNPNDPSAAAKFMLLYKALRALTDEVSMRNYRDYGNPDGPSILKVRIGLPSFLVEEKYQLLILCVFFVFLLIIIPGIFICYYQRQKKYAPNGVLFETLKRLYFNLGEGTRMKDLPEILAASAESSSLKLRKSDNNDMLKILKITDGAKKKRFASPIFFRNYLLIVAHIERQHDLLNVNLRNDLNFILSTSLLITRSMIEMAMWNHWMLTIKSIIEFRRCLIQSLSLDSSSLLQIPYFDDRTLSHCKKGKNAIKSLKEFVQQPLNDRKGLKGMTTEQTNDIQAFCEHLPDISLEAKVFVEDEDEIVLGDCATCEVTIERKNIKEGEAAGAVHSPFFPLVKFEEWWIFITDKRDGKILGFVCCTNHERVCKEHVNFEVYRSGKQVLEINAICDSYTGVDTSILTEFTAFTPDEVTRETFVHPEDAKLDNERSLLEQVIGTIASPNSSDDEYEELKVKKTKTKKREAEKRRENNEVNYDGGALEITDAEDENNHHEVSENSETISDS